MNAPLIPDIDAFEKRAAIAQYEGGLTRKQAENLAAKVQGFRDSEHYWQWMAEYVVSRAMGSVRALNDVPSSFLIREVGRPFRSKNSNDAHSREVAL